MGTKGNISVSLVISVLLFGTVGTVAAGTITVRADGTGDYPTIQAAINAANVGDEVELIAGTYTGSGNWDINFSGKAITVQGTDPNDPQIVETTIIDCNDPPSGAHYGFVFNSGETSQTTLAGLSITNATDGALWLENRSNPTIRNCNLYGNKGSQVIMCKGSSPYIRACQICNNPAGVNGAFVCTWQSTGPSSGFTSQPTIIGCSISYNGMHGLSITKSSPIVINTEIKSNYTFGITGDDFDFPPPDFDCTPMFQNCLIAGNWSDAVSFTNMGGEVTVTFKNCTITNSYGETGIHLECAGTSAVLENTIVSHNSLLQNGFPEIWLEYSYGGAPTISINHSAILGGQASIKADSGATVVWGTGNIDTDPNYIDPGYWLDPIPGEYDDDTWVEGNYRLDSISACIDAGDSASVPADSEDLDEDLNTTEPIPYDLDNHPRIVDGDCNSTDVVDMGAYEFSYVSLGDFAGGCDVDFADFAVLALAWLTEEGQAGYDQNCDIALPYDGAIDEKDLGIFTDNWLLGVE